MHAGRSSDSAFRSTDRTTAGHAIALPGLSARRVHAVELGGQLAAHEILDRLEDRLVLVEDLVDLADDRKLDPELLGEVVGALGGLHALGDVPQVRDDLCELSPL